MFDFDAKNDEILKEMRQRIIEKNTGRNKFFTIVDADDYPKAVLTAPMPSSAQFVAASVAAKTPLKSLIEITKQVRMPTTEIVVTDYLPSRTVQARRHKRKSSRRWQKKWLKRFGTKQVRDSEIFKIGNKILISPEMNRRLSKQLAKRVSDAVDAQTRLLWGL